MNDRLPQPQTRLRSSGRWLCTGVFLLLLIGLIGSSFFGIAWCSQDGRVEIAVVSGGLLIGLPPTGPQPGWALWMETRNPGDVLDWCWWFSYRPWSFYTPTTTTTGGEFAAPLWPFSLLAAIPTGFLWRDAIRARRFRRRERSGVCPACEYSRRGLGSDLPCPECGFVPIGSPAIEEVASLSSR